MSGNLLRFLASCRHQFSWPRRGDNGDYYQYCVNCGAKYRYDWGRMQRVAPLPEEEDAAVGCAKPPRKCGSKSAWVPRERRLRYRTPVQFRVAGSDEWMEGVSENVSRSGLLVRCAVPLQPGTKLELKFEMPPEIAETPAKAWCQGMVTRLASEPPSRKRQPQHLLACAIQSCTI